MENSAPNIPDSPTAVAVETSVSKVIPVTLITDKFSYAIRKSIPVHKRCMGKINGKEKQVPHIVYAAENNTTECSNDKKLTITTSGESDQSPNNEIYDERTPPSQTSLDNATKTLKSWAHRSDVDIILNNISICVQPGEMLVIMGPSGSGKTTLLNALAGRSKPSARVLQSGNIYYLGVSPYMPLSVFSTYIMQKDNVPDFLTVGEYVEQFSLLKMPSATDGERRARCQEVLKSLNLLHRYNTRIGGTSKKLLSGGEIKRLALAVELLNNPSLIFLDEPTSGLDASLAYDTMRLLLELARKHKRTVVCTVHQPRSQLFGLFDKLLVLNKGGVVFQGSANECCPYFANHGFICPPQFNPADFLMDIFSCSESKGEETTGTELEAIEYGTEEKIPNRLIFSPDAVNQLANLYADSLLNSRVNEEIQDCIKQQPPRTSQANRLKKLMKMNMHRWDHWWLQFRALLFMHTINLMRNPMSCIVQFGLNIMLAIIFGVVFWDIPGRGYDELSGRNMLGALLFLASQLGFGPMDSLVVFTDDRELFNRDTANGNYTPFAFFVAKSIANLPFQQGPLTVLLIIVYWMIGLTADASRFFIYLFVGQAVIFASSSFLFFISAASPRLAIAQSVAPVLLLVMLLVSGFYIRDSDIPVWISWVKWVSFIRYGYVCFAINEFSENPSWGELPKDFLYRLSGLEDDISLWLNIGLLIIIGFAMRVSAYFALAYCNRSIGIEA